MKTGYLGLPCFPLSDTPPFFGGEVRNNVGRLRKLVAAEIWSAITARLATDARVLELKGRLIGPGTSRGILDADNLAEWWIWRANEVGQETADKDLELFLSNPEVDSVQAIWVYGVETTDTQEVSPGVFLVPAKEMPLSHEREQFLETDIGYRPMPVVRPKAALVAHVSIPKAISDAQTDDMSVIWGVHQKLRNAILLMNCLPDTMCFTGFSSSYCPPEVPLGVFSGAAGGGFSLQDFLPYRSTKFNPSNNPLFSQLMASYRDLPEGIRTRLSRALHRLALAKGRLDDWNTALDLGIALEMVLLDKEHKGGLPGQLHLQFRLRGSWLVGSDLADRESVFRTLKEIYVNRSEVAHSGTSQTIEKMNPSEKSEMRKRHFTVAERILSHLVTKGYPANWDSLLLGGELGAG